MNNLRRKELRELILNIQHIVGVIEYKVEEEQNCYDALPEGLQNSEKGEIMEEAIENMGNAIDSLNEAIEAIEEAML